MILNKNDVISVNKYNDYVRNSIYGRFSQDINWENVKNNWKSEYVYLEQDGKIVAALSILIAKNSNGEYFMYANRGPVCDFSNTELVSELIDETKKIAKEYNAKYLIIDPEYLYDEKLVDKYRSLGYKFNSRETDIHKFIQPRYNMILNIKGKTEDEIAKEFHQKARYSIKIANKKGCETYWDNSPESINVFYELTKIMAKRHGITHRPKEYFERLIKSYPNSRLYITKHENDNLSTVIAIPYGIQMFYIYGASSNEKRNFMPNYQIHWEIIKWAISLGSIHEYNFGGVFGFDANDGLYSFKSKFCKHGATEFIGELIVEF